MGAFPRQKRARCFIATMTLFILSVCVRPSAFAQGEVVNPQDYEREELGVNRYTAPSIAHVFEQLDRLKKLPFDRLSRPLPTTSPTQREQKALIFGGLVADGFLIVEAQKRNLIDDYGRVLIREARGLGVAERVIKHSASLTDQAKRGDWNAVRDELITTQADVEQAMIDMRDQEMAHLISLGGWIRGLEISSGAVEADFSTERAVILLQPDLVDYFRDELNTLPPPIAHTPLFDKIRNGIHSIADTFAKATQGLQEPDVKSIHAQAHDLEQAIRGN